MVFGRGKLLFSVVALLVTGPVCFAQEDGVSFRIHHHYQSPRALGMGDAFVAVANDYSAIFYNPAGLARRTDGQINLSFGLGATPKFADISKDIQDAQNTPGSDADKQEALMEVINENAGNSYGLRVEAPSGLWVRPNWGIAVIPMDLSVQMDFHNQVGPAINTTVYADTTLAYAYARDFDWIQNSRFSMGVTGKFVNRGYFSKPVTLMEAAADPNLVKKEDLQEGYTVDADIGMLWTPNIPSEGWLSWLSLAKPTFGAVVRNVGELGFGQSLKLLNDVKTAAPEKLYRVLDVGTRWEYPELWIFSGRGTLDVRDIGHPLFSVRKGLHVGFEFDWTVASWWKGHYNVGLNQGYFTAGLGAQLTWFNLDLVTYAEDVGPYGHPVESRTYMARFNMDF
ncbi:hypothetical protein [Bdellovibrio sp. HCB337]|uniref:hypothetical protein n=1 Tax=Bdellovibrio sp. HCB337 TaxID=3394358 RepID=UPI0039A69E47